MPKRVRAVRLTYEAPSQPPVPSGLATRKWAVVTSPVKKGRSRCPS
jgi:hypothetical protein